MAPPTPRSVPAMSFSRPTIWLNARKPICYQLRVLDDVRCVAGNIRNQIFPAGSFTSRQILNMFVRFRGSTNQTRARTQDIPSRICLLNLVADSVKKNAKSFPSIDHGSKQRRRIEIPNLIRWSLRSLTKVALSPSRTRLPGRELLKAANSA
jgi:hypothetical protein